MLVADPDMGLRLGVLHPRLLKKLLAATLMTYIEQDLKFVNPAILTCFTTHPKKENS